MGLGILVGAAVSALLLLLFDVASLLLWYDSCFLHTLTTDPHVRTWY